MVNVDPSNPPNEFPDIVGPAPTNPILGRFRPFIPAAARLRELTPLPLIIGTLLGMVFGASSLYLVLKVGLTVSASIPVAVISITIFRLLSKMGMRDATILENNIVQTAGSAGESGLRFPRCAGRRFTSKSIAGAASRPDFVTRPRRHRRGYRLEPDPHGRLHRHRHHRARCNPR